MWCGTRGKEWRPTTTNDTAVSLSPLRGNRERGPQGGGGGFQKERGGLTGKGRGKRRDWGGGEGKAEHIRQILSVPIFLLAAAEFARESQESAVLSRNGRHVLLHP